MTSFLFPKEHDLYFVGRNGAGRICGVKVFAYGQVIDLRPIHSKGATGPCSIVIPVDKAEDLVRAVRNAAREQIRSSADTPQPVLFKWMERFGDWGEHPKYPRDDWQHLVAAGETQRGYWEHVMAKIEEEQLSCAQ